MHELTVNHFNFIEHQSEPYLSGTEICRKLGYKRPKHQASQVWKKHSEFLGDESMVLNLRTVDGKKREVRSYSKVGALCFIAKCNIAAADSITKKVIKAFVSIEGKLHSEKISWGAIRNEEKQIFKDVMDGVQTFGDYQKAQGSKNSKHVYSNVIRTVKAQLGFSQSTKPCDMNSKELVAFGTGLMVFEDNLKVGMHQSLPYKKVYLEAKEPLKALAANIKPVLIHAN